MSIKFYSRSRGTSIGADIKITMYRKKVGATQARISINKDTKKKFFGDAEYLMVGYDEDYPDRMYFAGASNKEGYLVKEATPYRDVCTITNKEAVKLLENFASDFELHEAEKGLCYIEKGIHFYNK